MGDWVSANTLLEHVSRAETELEARFRHYGGTVEIPDEIKGTADFGRCVKQRCQDVAVFAQERLCDRHYRQAHPRKYGRGG